MTRNPRRLGVHFAEAFSQLLPTGPAWPREPTTTLMRYLDGVAEVWGRDVDGRAHDLLDKEAFPDTTDEMLAEWERSFGLPEDCFEETVQTVARRRELLLRKITFLGEQNREYYLEIARSLGYVHARIEEFSPFRCGTSRCGSALWRTGSPLNRYFWRFFVGPTTLTWFRAGKSRVGAHPQAMIAHAVVLECLVRKYKPAHTRVWFLYDPPEGPTDAIYFRTGSPQSRVGRDPQANIVWD